MQIQPVDYVIAAVLGAGLLGSIVGVAIYEPDAAGGTAYDVAWPTESHILDTLTGTGNGPGDIEVTIPITQDNISRVDLSVQVSGDAANRLQPVPVSLTLEPAHADPINRNGNLIAGGSGTFTTGFNPAVQRVPGQAAVQANSTQEAHEKLSASGTFNQTLGQGDWLLTVTIQQTQTNTGPAAETYTVTVTGTVTTFSATITPQIGDINV